MDILTTTLIAGLSLARDLTVAWSPVLLIVAFVLIGMQATKMVRVARANAQIRAERAAREAYRAPVLDITHRLPSQHSNIA